MEESRDDNDVENSCRKEDLVSITWDPPTLQSIVSVALVGKMWTEPDMIHELPLEVITGYDFENNSEFPELEKIMMNKITENLPNLLQSIVSPFIRPIKIEFFKWLTSDIYKVFSFNDVREVGGAIYWTMEGTIDTVKTFQALIISEKPVKDYFKLYELACVYCLEEYIIDLLDKIPFKERRELDYIYERLIISEPQDFSFSQKTNYLLMYWTLTVRNGWHIMLKNLHNSRRNRRETDHDFGFLKLFILYSIHDSNKIAFKYFWQKIVNEEKNIINDLRLEQLAFEIVSGISNTYFRAFDFYEYSLKFLLTHVKDPVKQNYIARRNSCKFLLSYINDRYFRRIFKPSCLVPLMLRNISKDDYVSVMNEISIRLKYKKLGDVFEEIWSATLLNLKQMFLKRNPRNAIVFLLLSLMKIGHLKIALTVIRDISMAQRERIILHFMIGNCNLMDYIENTVDFDSLDALFLKLLPPNKNLESFKQEYIQKNYKRCCKWLSRVDFEFVEKFLKWIFQSERKKEGLKLSFPSKFIFIHLISLGNYDHVDQFVNLNFTKEREIEEIKNILFNEDNLKMLLHKFCEQRKRSIELFDKFTKYCVFSFEEVSGLKPLCLEHLKYVVKMKCFELASAILNWCFDDKDEADHYKTELLLSESGLLAGPPYDINMLKKMIWHLISWSYLMEWALPLSRKSITKLKNSLSRDEDFRDTDLNDLVRMREKLFRLLDSTSFAEFIEISACLKSVHFNPFPVESTREFLFKKSQKMPL